jgi:hypothetical protein
MEICLRVSSLRCSLTVWCHSGVSRTRELCIPMLCKISSIISVTVFRSDIPCTIMRCTFAMAVYRLLGRCFHHALRYISSSNGKSLSNLVFLSRPRNSVFLSSNVSDDYFGSFTLRSVLIVLWSSFQVLRRKR